MRIRWDKRHYFGYAFLQNAIENHFDTSFELEAMLEARVKRQLLDEVKSIIPKGVTLMHIRQGQPKGLGHAVLCAKPLIGEEPFGCIARHFVGRRQSCTPER